VAREEIRRERQRQTLGIGGAERMTAQHLRLEARDEIGDVGVAHREARGQGFGWREVDGPQELMDATQGKLHGHAARPETVIAPPHLVDAHAPGQEVNHAAGTAESPLVASPLAIAVGEIHLRRSARPQQDGVSFLRGDALELSGAREVADPDGQPRPIRIRERHAWFLDHEVAPLGH